MCVESHTGQRKKGLLKTQQTTTLISKILSVFLHELFYFHEFHQVIIKG